MNGLQFGLQSACEQLGLDVVFDKLVSLDHGIHVKVPAHILELGAPKGMLIFTESASVWPLREAIEAAGYGFSILSNRPTEQNVDIDAYKEMFMDWEWSGESSRKPGWFK